MPESCMKIETFNDYYTTIKETDDHGVGSGDHVITVITGTDPMIVNSLNKGSCRPHGYWKQRASRPITAMWAG